MEFCIVVYKKVNVMLTSHCVAFSEAFLSHMSGDSDQIAGVLKLTWIVFA